MKRRARGAALPEYAVTLLVACVVLVGFAQAGWMMLGNYRELRTKITKTGP